MEFRRGDEVLNGLGIITKSNVGGDERMCYVLWQDGSCGMYKKKSLTKTGRNYEKALLKLLSRFSYEDSIEMKSAKRHF